MTSPFTRLLAVQGQLFPSGSAWEPPGLWLLSHFHSQAYSPAFGCSSNSVLLAPSDFIQPGPSRARLWLRNAGGWTCRGPSGIWVSSDRSSLPATSTSRGRAEGTWETAREKRGIREEMPPATLPRAGRCSCTENHPEETIPVTMTMSAAWLWQSFLGD